MKVLSRATLFLGLMAGVGSALAADNSPVGTWKTIDDSTHQPRSIVEITEQGGELKGQVKQLLNLTPDEIKLDGAHPHCKRCTGERKDQPIEGLNIMWGVKRDGDVWDGGQILDPKSGKVYKVKLTPIDGGQKLEVRGYIGISLLGRTQTWERQN